MKQAGRELKQKQNMQKNLTVDSPMWHRTGLRAPRKQPMSPGWSASARGSSCKAGPRAGTCLLLVNLARGLAREVDLGGRLLSLSNIPVTIQAL